jgi:hypothetical protein
MHSEAAYEIPRDVLLRFPDAALEKELAELGESTLSGSPADFARRRAPSDVPSAVNTASELSRRVSRTSWTAAAS